MQTIFVLIMEGISVRLIHLASSNILLKEKSKCMHHQTALKQATCD